MNHEVEMNYRAACENVYGEGIWKAFVRGGKMSEAIKKVREITGLNLKDANDVCEYYHNIVLTTPIKVETINVGKTEVIVRTFPDGSFKTEISCKKLHSGVKELTDYLATLA